MKNNLVIIVGGGITGLSAAWYLEKNGFSNITLIEAGNRVGGKIETFHEDGFLVEKGPDSFIITKPYALDLIKELGLEDELISPKTNRFFVLKDGLMVSPPKGLNLMVPTDIFAFLESKFFSWPAKHRILQESTVPPNLSEEDESFADFINRRFGEEMLNLYAGPLFTGIYATPANMLSMNAAFPQLRKMEREHGSITRAIKKLPKPTGSGSRSTFLGLKNGMQTLSDTLIAKLKYTNICLNTRVENIKVDESHDNMSPNHKIYAITTSTGENYTTTDLIITLPVHIAKTLLQDIAPKGTQILGSFTTSSSTIVTLAYPKDAVSDPLLATGYMAAYHESNSVTAGTWLSSKWEGRAKDGYVLLRCFFGKSDKSANFTNDQFIQTAHHEMSHILGIKSQPEYYWVQRWENSLPQYKLGHLAKVEALQNELKSFPGLQLTGAYIAGVGLPDCIKQGKDAAEKVYEDLKRGIIPALS